VKTIRLMLPVLALALPAACLQGCMLTTPQWDQQFGAATRDNLAAQVLDPAAAANRQSATGIDGRAAKGAHDRYQRSFAQPESAPPALVINAGGAR
jgi:type IV pilus biogenesis protein CpaD/CtpE